MQKRKNMGVGLSMFFAMHRQHGRESSDAKLLEIEDLNLAQLRPHATMRRSRSDIQYATIVFGIWVVFSVLLCAITAAPVLMTVPLIIVGFCFHALIFHAMDRAEFLSARGGVTKRRLYFLSLILCFVLVYIAAVSVRLRFSIWNLGVATALKKSIYHGLRQIDTEEAGDALKGIIRILQDNNVTVWASEGTALGLVREGRILPWDDDVDVGVWDTDREKIVALLPKLDSERFVLADEQGLYFFKFLYGTTVVDMDMTGPGHYCHAASCPCDQVIPFLRPLTQVSFAGMLIPVPPSKYMVKLYGTAWRVPIQHSKPPCRGYSSNC